MAMIATLQSIFNSTYRKCFRQIEFLPFLPETFVAKHHCFRQDFENAILPETT
jgi:hypothetical protein